MTREAVRVAQVSQDKEEKWILDKFSYRSLDQEKISENLLEHKDYLSEEIELAMANAKITNKKMLHYLFQLRVQLLEWSLVR